MHKKAFKITLIPLPFSHKWEKGAIPASSEFLFAHLWERGLRE
jgi:hypothetical protein